MKNAIRLFLPLFLLLSLAAFPCTSDAFNQPPLNLGLTDILDGGPPGPGTYFTEYIQAYDADELKDKDGHKLPGNPEVAFVLSMNQGVYVSTYKLLGANVGVTALLPVVALSTSGTLGPPAPGNPPANTFTSNPDVLGDLIVGPFLQWFDTKMLGRPLIHRFEFDVVMPTGQYGKEYVVNPGSNIWTFEPYYAFTWFLTDKFSTSWRIMYDFHTENNDTGIQPGQVFHFNYSFEYAFLKNLWGSVAGYYLVQTTDDQYKGQDVSDSKEQVFGIGPALFWAANQNFSLGLKTAWETWTENRPQGNRTTLRMTYKF